MRRISLILILISFTSLLSADSLSWVFTDYAPANYVDGEGNYTGYLVDITREALNNRLGIPLEIEVYPWSRCQYLVQIGERDMLLTIPTKDRLEYAVPTESPVWVKRRYVYTSRGHEKLEEINGLFGLDQIKASGLTVVSYKGNHWVSENVEAAGIPVEYANSVDGMYRMLAAGRGDLVIEERSIARYNIEDLDLGERLTETDGVAEESGFHLFIGKKSPYIGILDDLNRVIDGMWADGTIQGILDRYGA